MLVVNAFISLISLILASWGAAICASTEEKEITFEKQCYPNTSSNLSFAVSNIIISLCLIIMSLIGIGFVLRHGKPYGFRKMGLTKPPGNTTPDRPNREEHPELYPNQAPVDSYKDDDFDRSHPQPRTVPNIPIEDSIESRKNALKSPSMSNVFNTSPTMQFEERKNALRLPSLNDLFNIATDTSSNTDQKKRMHRMKSASMSALVTPRQTVTAFEKWEENMDSASIPQKIGPMLHMGSKSFISLNPRALTVKSFETNDWNCPESPVLSRLHDMSPVTKRKENEKKSQKGPMHNKRSASASIVGDSMYSAQFEPDFVAPGQLSNFDKDKTEYSPKQLVRNIKSTSDIFALTSDFECDDTSSSSSSRRLPPLKSTGLASRYFEPRRSYHKNSSVRRHNNPRTIDVGISGTLRSLSPMSADNIPVIDTGSDDEGVETESVTSTDIQSARSVNREKKKVKSIKAIKKFKSLQDMFATVTKVTDGYNRKRVSSVVSLAPTEETDSDELTSYQVKLNRRKNRFINVGSTHWSPSSSIGKHGASQDGTETATDNSVIEGLTHF